MRRLSTVVSTLHASKPYQLRGFALTPRQSIREFCDLDMPIFMFNVEGRYAVLKLGEV